MFRYFYILNFTRSSYFQAQHYAVGKVRFCVKGFVATPTLGVACHFYDIPRNIGVEAFTVWTSSYGDIKPSLLHRVHLTSSISLKTVLKVNN
jgi:hypothetical protein